jgi:CRISPR-associated protein Cas1
MMTVIVEPPYELKTEGKTLRMEQAGLLVKRIPFYQIDCLMIRGKVPLCADVLRQSAAHAVPVLITASRVGTDAAWVTAGQQPSVMLRIAQHRVLADQKLTIDMARKAVQAKFNGYRIALQLPQSQVAPADHRRLFESRLSQSDILLSNASNLDTIRGIEGNAAKLWFNFMSQQLHKDWAFNGRNRQPPKDPVNALLSFSYSMIQADIRSAIQLRGFDCDIGFLHSPSPARASLILDVLEPLRPLADSFVLALCQKLLMPTQFHTEQNGASRLGKEARPIYFSEITRWRQDVMNALAKPVDKPLWPDKPIPASIESLADLCRHLAHHLANDLLTISQTEEPEIPSGFADQTDE